MDAHGEEGGRGRFFAALRMTGILSVGAPGAPHIKLIALLEGHFAVAPGARR